MKYFTPKLYVQFNSNDDDKADQADAQWEEAIKNYQKHLKQITPKLTESVRELAKTLDLHDAYYLGLSLPQIPGDNGSLAVLMLRQNATLVALIYLLSEEPLIREVPQPWPFSREKVHWLYDEFDVTKQGIQQHEILLSNGRIMTLKFRELQLMRHEIHEEVAVA